MKCSLHISLISVCNKDDVCSCVSFHCYSECGPEMPCDDPMVCTNGLCALACTTDGKLKTTQVFENKLSSTNTCSVNNIMCRQNIFLKMCRILLRSCRFFREWHLALQWKYIMMTYIQILMLLNFGVSRFLWITDYTWYCLQTKSFLVAICSQSFVVFKTAPFGQKPSGRIEGDQKFYRKFIYHFLQKNFRKNDSETRLFFLSVYNIIITIEPVWLQPVKTVRNHRLITG